ncbi:UNVERIFIED_CONTAM: hypothetical protein K2H54_004720 [Gekko kuhli]
MERRVAVAVWWMANTMSYRTVGQQFGLARSTVAGIVLEVTRAITERLLDRVVYLRNPDRGHFSMPTALPRFQRSLVNCRCDDTQSCKFACAALRAAVSLRMRMPKIFISIKLKNGWEAVPHKRDFMVQGGDKLPPLHPNPMDAGPRVMTSTHLETQDLFEEVAGAGEQLRAKFKREKVAFFDSLEDWRGIPPPRGYRPPSFSLLRELWEQEGRPGWQLRTPNRPPRAPRKLPAAEDQREEAGPAQDPGEVPGAHDPVVGVSSSPDRSPASASEAESAHHSGQEEEEAGREEEEAGIQISSGTEGDAGEGQLPGPAPGPQQGHDQRRSSLEEQMVEIRRTLKRHTYCLSFIQQAMVRLRKMVQRSQGRGRQQRRRRRHQDPPQAPRPSSPLASMAEGNSQAVHLQSIGTYRQQPRDARPGRQRPPPPSLREKDDESSTATATAHGVRYCQQAAAEGSPAWAAVPSSREKEDESSTATAHGVCCCQQAAAEGSPARAAAPSSSREKEDESSMATAVAHGVRCCQMAAAEGSPSRAAAPSSREKDESSTATARGVRCCQQAAAEGSPARAAAPSSREKEDESSMATARGVRCCQMAAAEGSPARAAAPSSREKEDESSMATACSSRESPARAAAPSSREKEDESSTATARGVRCCQQAAAEGSPARAAVPSSREKEDESSTATARGVRCCQQAAAEGSPARAAAPSSREKEDKSSMATACGVRCCQQAAAGGSPARAAVPSSLREKEDESSMVKAMVCGVRCCQQAAAEGSPAWAAAPSSLREKEEDESRMAAAARGVSPIRHCQQLKDAWPGRRRRPPPGHLKVKKGRSKASSGCSLEARKGGKRESADWQFPCPFPPALLRIALAATALPAKFPRVQASAWPCSWAWLPPPPLLPAWAMSSSWCRSPSR